MSHREIIRSNMSTLCDGTRLTLRLLNDCVQHEVLNIDERDEMEAMITNTASYNTKSKFYSLFRTKGSEEYERFVKLIKAGENQQPDHVVKILRLGLSESCPLEFEDGWFECHEPVTTFCGRADELKQLHASMTRDSNQLTVTKFSRTTVISGLGGVGKSELARKYAYEYSHFYQNNVIWINAESRSSLTESFRKYARCKLNLVVNDVHGWEKDIAFIVRDVYSFFHGRKSLFIFDNAEKFKSYIDTEGDEGTGQYFPQILPNGTRPYVLVTSRCIGWIEKIQVLRLGPLKAVEAVEFVLNVNELSNEEPLNINKLVDTLGYLPLALQQAIAYIKRTIQVEESIGSAKKFGIEQYLELYAENTEEPLNYQYSHDTEDNYIWPTLVCWEMTLRRIREEKFGMEALQILNCMAYLCPYGIPTSIFSHLLEGHATEMEDKFALSAAVGLLTQYSMVENNYGELRIHRLVQDVTRVKLNKTKEEPKILAVALCAITQTVLTILDEKKFDKKSGICMQALSVWHYAESYFDVLQDFRQFPIHICRILTEFGRYKEAAIFGERATHYLLQSLEESNETVLSLKFQTANAFLEQGQFKKASILFRAIDEQRSETSDGNVPVVMTKLAYIHYKQGNYQLALEHCEQILKSGKSRTETDILDALYYKSRVLMTIGMLVESSQILECLYNLHYGLDNKNMLKCGHYLAVSLRKQGKLAEASVILDAVIAGRTRSMLANHPLTLSSEIQRGVIHYYQENYDRASEILERCLVEVEKAPGMGIDNPTYFLTRTYLALILRKKGELVAALENFNEILHRAKTQLGSICAECLKAERQIAKIHMELGNYKEAETLFVILYKIRLDQSGPNGSDTLTERHNMARILEYQGQDNEALKIFQEVRDIRKVELGDDHPDTLTSIYRIGVLMKKLGYIEEVKALLTYVYDIRLRMFGATHSKVIEVRDILNDLRKS